MRPSNKELQGVTWAEGRWVPKRGIVAIDSRDGMMDNQQILDLLKVQPEVGVVLITGEDKDGAFWEPYSRIQRVAVRDFSLEQVLSMVQPEVFVTTARPEPEAIHPDRVVNPMMSQYLVTRIEKTLERGEYQTPEATLTLKERWRGSRKQENPTLGVMGLANYVKPEPSPSKFEQWFAENPWFREYDAGIAELGLFASLYGAFSESGSVPATALNATLLTLPVMGWLSRKLEQRMTSERWEEVLKAGQKVMGSLFTFGVAAKLGSIALTLLGVTSGEVASIGKAMQSQWAPQELDKSRSQAFTFTKRDLETTLTQPEISPDLTWEGLDDYYHSLLGARDWVNQENGRDLSDVMTHWNLMHEGTLPLDDETLTAMVGTSDYDDYLRARAAGQIYP